MPVDTHRLASRFHRKRTVAAVVIGAAGVAGVSWLPKASEQQAKAAGVPRSASNDQIECCPNCIC
jgi:hypothetical protein